MLVDSRPGIVHCVNETLIAFGYAALPNERIERIIGPPLRDGFAELIAERGGDGSEVPDCVLRYRELYEDVATTGGTLLQPGIDGMLAALRSMATLAVATSKPLRFAEPILAVLGIRNSFAVVAGPTPETDGESKADTLRRAMDAVAQKAGVVPNAGDSFMVGDRCHDVAAAIACRIVPVGVTWGFGSERELRDSGAAYLISAPADLPLLVRRVAGAV